VTDAHQETVDTSMADSPGLKTLAEKWSNMWLDTPQAKKMYVLMFLVSCSTLFLILGRNHYMQENTILSASKNWYESFNTKKTPQTNTSFSGVFVVNEKNEVENETNTKISKPKQPNFNQARPLTIPKEFNFSTDARLKRKTALNITKSPAISKVLDL
jgi:hypothetical protein